MASIPSDIAPYLGKDLLDWLLSGDVSVQYQVRRDLLDSSPRALAALRKRIPADGWGANFLSRRGPDGWWPGWYGPKWISTHYTLLELMGIGMDVSRAELRPVIRQYVNGMWSSGPYDRRRKRWFDACVAAMLLSIAAKAGLEGMDESVRGIVDYLLEREMGDGGWNCGWWRGDPIPVKSSLHTTISVLEAFRDLSWKDRDGAPSWPRAGAAISRASALRSYRERERKAASGRAGELLLERRIYMKLSADEAIEPRFARMSFPCRWHFDFLRALDWFASVGRKRDARMDAAIRLLLSMRADDGTWPLQERHSGKFHFHMESAGKRSRWNTLRALRVIRAMGVR